MEYYFNLFLSYVKRSFCWIKKFLKFTICATTLFICALFTIGVVLFVYSGAFDGFVILFGWCIEINGHCSNNVYYDFLRWMHEVINKPS